MFLQEVANDVPHLAEVATDSTLSVIWWLRHNSKAFLSDVEFCLDYAYATDNAQKYMAGEETAVISDTSKETTTLPA